MKLLESLGLREKGLRPPRVLLVLFRTEEEVWKSLRNLGERVQVLLPEELNTYDVLLNDWIVFSQASLDGTIARLSDGGTTDDATSEDAANDESEEVQA